MLLEILLVDALVLPWITGWEKYTLIHHRAINCICLQWSRRNNYFDMLEGLLVCRFISGIHFWLNQVLDCAVVSILGRLRLLHGDVVGYSYHKSNHSFTYRNTIDSLICRPPGRAISWPFRPASLIPMVTWWVTERTWHTRYCRRPDLIHECLFFDW